MGLIAICILATQIHLLKGNVSHCAIAEDHGLQLIFLSDLKPLINEIHSRSQRIEMSQLQSSLTSLNRKWLQGVWFNAHRPRDGCWRSADDLQWSSCGRFKVFVARHGHGTYPDVSFQEP